MVETIVNIEYYHSHDRKFVPFFRGSEEYAHEFMKLHGHLHRIYKIYEVRYVAPAQRETAAAV
jgi:hypothetical protein